jgi:hypothetical protein
VAGCGPRKVPAMFYGRLLKAGLSTRAGLGSAQREAKLRGWPQKDENDVDLSQWWLPGVGENSKGDALDADAVLPWCCVGGKLAPPTQAALSSDRAVSLVVLLLWESCARMWEGRPSTRQIPTECGGFLQNTAGSHRTG